MRLEVLVVSSGDIQIYPLNRPKIIIGSGDVCDIVISAVGVSRKHVIVTSENDQFFVADQGSTNGTYINEERLQPGKRVEFTSFFPVRLGENILLTLLSDDDSNGLDFSEFNAPKSGGTSSSIKVDEKTDATRSVSLAELNATKTQSLVKKRKDIEKIKAKAAPQKKIKKEPDTDKSRMLVAKLGAILILGSAVYYNVVMKEAAVEDENVAKIGEQVVVDPSTLPKKETLLLPEEEKISYETLLASVKDMKCVSDVEKHLCDNLRGAKDAPWGVAQVKLMLNIMVDGTPYFEDAKKHVPLPKEMSEQNIAQYLKDVNETAIASYIVYAVPDNLNYELLKDYNLTFALFNAAQEKVEIAAVMSPAALKKAKESIKEASLYEIRNSGVKAIQITRELYRVY